MSITNLLNNMPSLVSYMNNEDTKDADSFFATRSQQISNTLQVANNTAQTTSDAYVLDLSPEAQEMMADNTSDNSNTVIKKAQAHFLSFFEDNGVILDNLSDEAVELLEGIVTFLQESETTTRDTSTDSLELKASGGKRDVYTLIGENRRIRLAIEENDTGQKMLSLVDIQGNQADIAQFTIETDEDGDANINLIRSKETFAHGERVSREEKDPITVKT